MYLKRFRSFQKGIIGHCRLKLERAIKFAGFIKEFANQHSARVELLMALSVLFTPGMNILLRTVCCKILVRAPTIKRILLVCLH